MSSYATPTDLQQNTLTAGALTGVSTGDQQAAIDAASAKADSYLGSQFTLPLVSWGKDLTLAVCQIAALNIMQRRGFNPDAGHDQLIVDQADKAVLWLRDIAMQRIKPYGIVDSAPTAVSVSRVTSNTPRGY